MIHQTNAGEGVARSAPCPKCGQVPNGQGGEYPCSLCGLPTLHDDPPLSILPIETEIVTEDEYTAALAEVEPLMGAVKGTTESRRLDALVTRIQEYERIHYPIDLPTPESTAEPDRIRGVFAPEHKRETLFTGAIDWHAVKISPDCPPEMVKQWQEFLASPDVEDVQLPSDAEPPPA